MTSWSYITPTFALHPLKGCKTYSFKTPKMYNFLLSNASLQFKPYPCHNCPFHKFLKSPDYFPSVWCHFNISLVHILTPNTFNSWLSYQMHFRTTSWRILLSHSQVRVPFSWLLSSLITQRINYSRLITRSLPVCSTRRTNKLVRLKPARENAKIAK
jgi:hypothetical protein